MWDRTGRFGRPETLDWIGSLRSNSSSRTSDAESGRAVSCGSSDCGPVETSGHCQHSRYGSVGDTAYIATAYVEGETLDRWIESRHVTPRMAAEICIQVADALHHAHESGIIHRDIKPTNILIDRDDRA